MFAAAEIALCRAPDAARAAGRRREARRPHRPPPGRGPAALQPPSRSSSRSSASWPRPSGGAFSAVADAISAIPWEPVARRGQSRSSSSPCSSADLDHRRRLVPKTLALNFPGGSRCWPLAPRLMERFLNPLVWPTTISGFMVRLFGGRERPQTGLLSVEELKLLVETGSAQGQIEEAEKEMIHGVIELGDKQIHEVMIPASGSRRSRSTSRSTVLDSHRQAGHSRPGLPREPRQHRRHPTPRTCCRTSARPPTPRRTDRHPGLARPAATCPRRSGWTRC